MLRHIHLAAQHPLAVVIDRLLKIAAKTPRQDPIIDLKPNAIHGAIPSVTDNVNPTSGSPAKPCAGNLLDKTAQPATPPHLKPSPATPLLCRSSLSLSP